MTPDDFPMHRMGDLQRSLTIQADEMRDRARGRLLEGTPGATGFYEAALAFSDAARWASQTGHDMAADIARRAEQEAQQAENPHSWPVPGLELVDADSPGIDDWGVELDSRTDEAMHLTLKTNVDGDAILTLITTDGRGNRDATAAVMDARSWAALRALGDRIFAGVPVPINEAGDLRGSDVADARSKYRAAP